MVAETGGSGGGSFRGMDVSEAQMAALRVVHQAFLPWGEWPVFDYVDREIYKRSGEGLPEVLGPLRPLLVQFDPYESPASDVRLTIRGLAVLPEARDDVDRFIEAVRWCVERERDYPSDPAKSGGARITSTELAAFLGEPDANPVMRRLYQLLSLEGVTSGGSSSEAGWEASLSRRIRRFAEVESLDDYLAVTDTDADRESLRSSAVMQRGRALDTRGWIPDERELDRGANSVVYLARRDKSIEVLKVCSAWRPESERYQRFVAEIQALEELSDESGVMRVLDSDVPVPGKEQFPWYVMPQGIPLSKLRAEAPLDEIVPGLASIAETLRAMHDREYSHRDVKPSNLFVMNDGTYVVGDLGLVGVPEEFRRSLTREGRSLGPANFMAPEMLEYIPGTDARLADVYSLAKTTWALVAKRNYPLPGHQRADDHESLAALTGESRAGELDRLIDAATEHDPARRPTMAEMATELKTWVDARLAERGPAEEDELSAAIAGARTRLSSQLSEAKSAATALETANEAFSQLVTAMDVIVTALPQLGASRAIGDDQMFDATLGHPFLEVLGAPRIVWRNQDFAYAQLGEDYNGVRLAVAYATVLYEGQSLVSAVGILVYGIPPTLGSGGFAWHDNFEAPAGTLTVSQETQRLVQRAREQMPAAITSFSDLAERL